MPKLLLIPINSSQNLNLEHIQRFFSLKTSQYARKLFRKSQDETDLEMGNLLQHININKRKSFTEYQLESGDIGLLAKLGDASIRLVNADPSQQEEKFIRSEEFKQICQKELQAQPYDVFIQVVQIHFNTKFAQKQITFVFTSLALSAQTKTEAISMLSVYITEVISRGFLCINGQLPPGLPQPFVIQNDEGVQCIIAPDQLEAPILQAGAYTGILAIVTEYILLYQHFSAYLITEKKLIHRQFFYNFTSQDFQLTLKTTQTTHMHDKLDYSFILHEAQKQIMKKSQIQSFFVSVADLISENSPNIITKYVEITNLNQDLTVYDFDNSLEIEQPLEYLEYKLAEGYIYFQTLQLPLGSDHGIYDSVHCIVDTKMFPHWNEEQQIPAEKCLNVKIMAEENKNILEKREPKICMLGLTGSGKSSLCNEIIFQDGNDPIFFVNDNLDSLTNDLKIYYAPWFDKQDNVTVIDVPGFGDSQGRDQQFLDQLCQGIKNQGEIDVFILVIKKDRMSSLFWEMLALYKEMLGPNCWQNFVIVLTGVDFISEDIETKEEYQRLLEKEEQQFQEQFSSKLKEQKTLIVALSLRQPQNGKKRNQICNQLANYITEKVTKANKDDKDKWISEINFENYLKIKTETDILSFIRENCKKILLQNLEKFHQEAQEWAEKLSAANIKGEIQEENFYSFKNEVIIFFKDGSLFSLLGALKMATLEMTLSQLSFYSMGGFAIFGVYCIAMKAKWSRNEVVEKTIKTILDNIEKTKDHLISKVLDAWKQAIEKALEIAQQRSNIIGDANDYSMFLQQKQLQ
ncbi:aig1 family [Stylonychia lemnae]|uniref:Aig1 family n=1 Tax=Stylonychia lemnae TaxID=5949 RepID=A0A078AYZ4_STYLE|nr:aig1 family [Stylonychia lemnae]|eukprot:CDW86407.1 aig1 family [Stylonychia lemnae]